MVASMPASNEDIFPDAVLYSLLPAEVCEMIAGRIEAGEESCVDLNGLLPWANAPTKFSFMNTLSNDDKLAIRATEDAGAIAGPATEFGGGEFFHSVYPLYASNEVKVGPGERTGDINRLYIVRQCC